MRLAQVVGNTVISRECSNLIGQNSVSNKYSINIFVYHCWVVAKLMLYLGVRMLYSGVKVPYIHDSANLENNTTIIRSKIISGRPTF